MLTMASGLAMAYPDTSPTGGYVPNAEVARRVAIEFLIPIYGNDEVRQEMPYSAILKGDVWIVRGTVKDLPSVVHFGHPLEIWISRSTGQVMRVEVEN